jgi:DNA transformation protein and related proteins
VRCPGCGATHAHSHDEDAIEELPNLGAVSAEWLKQVGITTLAELTVLGSVQAYRRVQKLGVKPSLNLLYALEGAIRGSHWLEVKRDSKTELLAMLDSVKEAGER